MRGISRDVRARSGSPDTQMGRGSEAQSGADLVSRRVAEWEGKREPRCRTHSTCQNTGAERSSRGEQGVGSLSTEVKSTAQLICELVARVERYAGRPAAAA